MIYTDLAKHYMIHISVYVRIPHNYANWGGGRTGKESSFRDGTVTVTDESVYLPVLNAYTNTSILTILINVHT